jgi:AcrR family transcriptional regulator
MTMDDQSTTEDGTRERPSERSGRREQNKAENRAALLKAARSVFAEMGYAAAGVRDIVRRTDLASGTFYNYFKDKQEIFGAVVGDIGVELHQRHREGRARATTAEEFFRAHCSAYMNFVAADPEMLAFGRNNVAAIRNLFDTPDLKPLADALVDDIRAAMAQGVLPKVDPGYLIAILTGVVFEMSVVMVSRNPVDPVGAAEFATQILLGGIHKAPKVG